MDLYLDSVTAMSHERDHERYCVTMRLFCRSLGTAIIRCRVGTGNRSKQKRCTEVTRDGFMVEQGVRRTFHWSTGISEVLGA